MVENTRRIDHLPPHVVVIQVPHEQRLRRKRVWLHVHIGRGDNVHKGTLSDVWVASEDQRSSRRVDGRQSAQMLSDLLEIRQGSREFLHHGAHTPKGSALEHFCLVQTVRELHHANVVLRDVLENLLARVNLPQRELVVVAIVEHVAEIRVEGVDVVDLGEVLEDLFESLAERGLAELHLAHVEGSNTRDLEARMHHRGGLALCF
mmetsp:Transcript_61413/g.163386  ORF Transcript_61413/g.163386 Transcript_61413/m.163386 type:complete len:205 (-) Transcript_61413:121-735(-)